MSLRDWPGLRYTPPPPERSFDALSAGTIQLAANLRK